MAFNDNNQQDFIRSNPNLKSPTYTQYVSADILKQRLEETRKIFTDIDYFARNYFYIVSLDKGKCLIEPYKKQTELLQSLTKFKRNIVLASRQVGKCLDENSLIKIRNKKTGQIQEITIKQFFEMCKDKNNI